MFTLGKNLRADGTTVSDSLISLPFVCFLFSTGMKTHYASLSVMYDQRSSDHTEPFGRPAVCGKRNFDVCFLILRDYAKRNDSNCV